LDWSVVCVLFSLVIGCLAGPLCGVLSSLGVLVFAGLFALLWWSPSHLRIAKPPKGSFLFPVFEQVSPFFSTALVAHGKKNLAQLRFWWRGCWRLEESNELELEFVLIFFPA
jgi:hypothetical protein